jgi:hypothetical protein
MQGNETIVAVMGMISVFGLPVILVAIILWFKHRKLKMTHETIARLAEKGLPVPPELLEPPARASNAALRGGLVLVGLGIALAVFFATTRGPWSIGLIPGLMGVALLIAWRIESRQGDRGSQPPR